MNFFDTLLAKKLSESGGNNPDSGNLFNSAIEVGTIDATGKLVEREQRLRTKDFIHLDSGNYTLVWSSEKQLRVFVFIYDNEGTFIERYPDVGSGCPLQFVTSNDANVKFIWLGYPDDTIDLVPSDLGTLTLVKV